VTTIAGALRAATGRLTAVSDTARLDAELLMAKALGVSRSELLLRHGERDARPHLAVFEQFVSRRMAHEPLAYILGEQEFYGLTFAVRPGVLIPRADSETTLQAALDAAAPDARVLDCGTGSGALLLTFLHERPAASGWGIDAHAMPLMVAAANAERLGLAGRACFVGRDWNAEGWSADLGTFDLVLANPPYVETDADLDRDVRDFEPHEALLSGPEGLDDYRILIPQLPGLLNPGGVAVVEIGHRQDESVARIAKEAGFSVKLYRDLADRPRALLLH